MHFVKMATDCWTAVVASSGFFIVAAATAIEMEKKEKTADMDETVDTATASG